MGMVQWMPARRSIALASVVGLATFACGDGPPSGLGSLEPERLRLNMHGVRLAIGGDTTVVATFHDGYGHEIPAGATRLQVAWSTSDPAVATVANGVVRGVGVGQAIVTAMAAPLAPAFVEVHVLAPDGQGVMDGYQAIALGRLGGTRSNAHAINSRGVIAGWSDVDGNRAFRWSEEEGMVMLQETSSSRGINNDGSIVGHFVHAHGFSAYIHVDGVRTELMGLDTEVNSDAYRINDAGTIVGRSGGPGWRAVVWTRLPDGRYGKPLLLGGLNGYGTITESPVINDRGDVAFTTFMGHNQPLLWRMGADGSHGEAVWLGRPAGGSYFVRDINDAGLIVGYRWSGIQEIAVLWHPSDYSTPIDLGVGQAWGINAAGQIVGVAGGELAPFGGGERRPALWLVAGREAGERTDTENRAPDIDGPFDIGTPSGFNYAGARAINDSGWIVGSAWGPGQVMATLWRPDF